VPYLKLLQAQAMQNFKEFHLTERPDMLLDTRACGPVEMMTLAQDSGAFPDPASDSYNLILCTSGHAAHCEMTFGGSLHASYVKPNSISVAPLRTECNYELSAAHQILVFQLPGQLIRSARQALGVGGVDDLGVLHSGLFQDWSLAQEMQRMWRSAAEAPRADIDLETMVVDLSERLVRMSLSATSAKPQRLHLTWRALQRVIEFVDAQIGNALPLELLAGIAHLSEFHFVRAFKAQVGVTPHQYVMAQRVERAKALLKRQHSGLADVAYACGFSSHQHLSTVFKAFEGRTPAEFRRVARYFGPSLSGAVSA
jgi:AraC family transcriptional regulator